MSELLGVATAGAAATMYSIGVTLQGLEARETPAEESLRPALLRRLVVRPRWIGGTSCVVCGWALQALALAFAPLTVVQPTLAAGLFVLLYVGTRLSDEIVRPRDVLSVLAITAGVTGLAIAAPPQGRSDGEPLAIVLGLTLLGAAALVLLMLARGRRRTAALVAVSAGLAYAWVGFSTQFLSDAVPAGGWLAVGVWLAATIIAAIVGLISEMTALQDRSAIRVFPIVLVVQIVVAVLLAPLLAGEGFGGGAVTAVASVVSLAAVAAGAGALAGTRAVGAAVSESSVPRVPAAPRGAPS